jgi:hypothetical protein
MKAESLGYQGSHGKSTEYIKCSCGYQNMFYIWSWAGHGFAVCAKCTAKISYRTLEVKSGEVRR